MSPAEARATREQPSVVDLRDLRVRVDTAGGPGGQHANRTRSRVTVELDLRTASLGESARSRLREAFGDVVRSTSAASRSQADNRKAAQSRLLRRIARALEVRPPRKSTSPSRGAVERRLQEKKRRSSVKRSRGVADDE